MKKLVIETSWFKVEVESKEDFMKYCAHTNLTKAYAKLIGEKPENVYIFNGVYVITHGDLNNVFLKDYKHDYYIDFTNNTFKITR